MKIIEPPAPLEYTEITEPDAQALRFEATIFLRVLRALQGAARVVKFIFQGVVMSGGTPETMKMTYIVVRQQPTALLEGDGNIFCLTAPACNAVFWKPRRVSRPPCGQKTVL